MSIKAMLARGSALAAVLTVALVGCAPKEETPANVGGNAAGGGLEAPIEGVQEAPAEGAAQ